VFLPQIPFFKHDGPEVEIAAAGNFRIADKPEITKVKRDNHYNAMAGLHLILMTGEMPSCKR